VHAADSAADAAACEAAAAADASDCVQAAEQQDPPAPEPCIATATHPQDRFHASATPDEDEPHPAAQPQGVCALHRRRRSSSSSTAGSQAGHTAATGSTTPRMEVQIPSALRLDLPSSPTGQMTGALTDKAASQSTDSPLQQGVDRTAVLESPTRCMSPTQQLAAGGKKAARRAAATAANSRSSSSTAAVSPTAAAGAAVTQSAPHVPVFRRLMNTAFGRSLTLSSSHSPFSLAALRSSVKSPKAQDSRALPSPQGWDSPAASATASTAAAAAAVAAAASKQTLAVPQGWESPAPSAATIPQASSILAVTSTTSKSAAEVKNADLGNSRISSSDSPAKKVEGGSTVKAGGGLATAILSPAVSFSSFSNGLGTSNSSFGRLGPVCKITGGSTSNGGSAPAARSRIPSLGGAVIGATQAPPTNNSTQAPQQVRAAGGASSAGGAVLAPIKSRIPSLGGAPAGSAAAAYNPNVVDTKMAAVTGNSVQARSRITGGASAVPTRIPTPNHSSCGAVRAALRKTRTSCTTGSSSGGGGWNGSSGGGSNGSSGGSPHLAGKSRIPVFSDSEKGGKTSLAGSTRDLRTLESSSGGGSSSPLLTPRVRSLLSKTPSRIPSLLIGSAVGAAAVDASTPAPAAGEFDGTVAATPTSPTAAEAGAAFKRAVELQQSSAASAGAAAAAASGHVTAITATAAFGTVRTLQKVKLKAGSGSTDGFCITLAAPSAVARGTAAAMAAAVGIHPDTTVTMPDSVSSIRQSARHASGACSPTGRRRMLAESPVPHGMGSHHSSSPSTQGRQS
jgi:hypothetical protein